MLCVVRTLGCKSVKTWKGENRALEKVVSEEKQVQMPNLYSLEN